MCRCREIKKKKKTEKENKAGLGFSDIFVREVIVSRWGGTEGTSMTVGGLG